ncbi:helix-turn-helix domain-containing protein [Stenotrophomonas maltophilia]|uniref:helix-turn-helix domain-containing protein n=1 Tax=Stenotrophomonas maltophilia TaxID=40324 RepID=UPI001F33A24E|nr:helix-turn-helix domain-containing protein [Stenotrophomonas maltophilia]MCF3470382.1 helix-turn-helix domain-containing protein [Stenotrophomonas maltophilia]
MSLGLRIREERTRLKLSQDAFAQLSGITRTTQHLYEQDVRDPGASYLVAAMSHGVDAWYVLTGERQLPSATAAADRSIYMEAFRAVDELGRDGRGVPLPLIDRTLLFDFLMKLLLQEPGRELTAADLAQEQIKKSASR